MNSIDKNQPEENRKDLNGKEAVEKIQELVKKAASCFFCTNTGDVSLTATRPMSVQQVDDEGNLWFLSASDSRKNAEILANSSVKLFFQGSAHSDFLSLDGQASISRDLNKIKELWGPLLKTWFTGGQQDPRISVIRFTPHNGQYWDTKHGQIVAFAKQVAGAVIGKTLDDSVSGNIRL